jgi:hypothetical protein
LITKQLSGHEKRDCKLSHDRSRAFWFFVPILSW